MRPFVLNRRGKLVFPSNFTPDLDFSTISSEAQLDSVIRRDFETKTPTGSEIRNRIDFGRYATRYELMRDVALNLFWVNRFALTMYDKLPMRWRDVPRKQDDIFVPIVLPWEDKESKVGAVAQAYQDLPAAWDGDAEDRVWKVLFGIYAQRTYDATELPSVKPTVAEALAHPDWMTITVRDYDPDFPRFSYTDIVDADEDVPELEALLRWAMVLHNSYPWNPATTVLKPVGELADEDVVVMFRPRSPEVLRFVQQVKAGRSEIAGVSKSMRMNDVPSVSPVSPYPPTDVVHGYRVQPVISALVAAKGEIVCSNDDVIRNAAYSWSPMSAAEISSKTGIEERRYSALELDELSLAAAKAALAKSGHGPGDIGAVVFCSCTSHRMMPSMATWLSGQLGMYQTHSSVDMVAACAGLPYGLSEAVRLLQEVRRPVLLVTGEKFSDKIGTVRPSRMIFGDGAAALVIEPAGPGQASDIDLLQTYASGPASQVNSIIWPNPVFDNNITLFGPEVRDLAGRYLTQMIEELQSQPDPIGANESAWDGVQLVVPHQANKTMVLKLAAAAGLSADKLYFNIETMGNTSSASIPIAIADAVEQGVIDRPLKVFAPGFGAGAVAGYAIVTIDPAVVTSIDVGSLNADLEPVAVAETSFPETGRGPAPTGSDDAEVAFGG